MQLVSEHRRMRRGYDSQAAASHVKRKDYAQEPAHSSVKPNSSAAVISEGAWWTTISFLLVVRTIIISNDNMRYHVILAVLALSSDNKGAGSDCCSSMSRSSCRSAISSFEVEFEPILDPELLYAVSVSLAGPSGEM